MLIPQEIFNAKQIPKKPEKEESGELFSKSWWFRCPVCHDPIDYKQYKCGWCHQKIDWTEDGEQE